MLSRAFVFFLLLAVATVGGAHPWANAGGCSATGCGGDFSVSEFEDLLTEVIFDLKTASLGGYMALTGLQKRDDQSGRMESVDLLIDVRVLEYAVRSVHVVDGELQVDGKSVGFKSDPKSGNVDFSLYEWVAHPSTEERIRMVIHEVLMLASGQGYPEYNDYLYGLQLSAKLQELVLWESPTLRADRCAKGMKDLIRLLTVYRGVADGCARVAKPSSDYEKLKEFARNVEEAYPSHLKLCHDFCDFESLPRNLCDSYTVSGACP